MTGSAEMWNNIYCPWFPMDVVERNALSNLIVIFSFDPAFSLLDLVFLNISQIYDTVGVFKNNNYSMRGGLTNLLIT